MTDREKVIKGLECCKWSRQNVKPEKNKCDECPYKDKSIMNAFSVWRSCTNVLAGDALVLLKEQDEMLHKKQKDIDRLCNEISEWKHKFHDILLKEQESVVPHMVDLGIYECPICKTRVDKTYKFCNVCGKGMNWE